MRTDISYEVTDLRERPENPLGPVGIIHYAPNGLIIEANNERGLFVDLSDDDDDDIFTDREDEGVVMFDLDDGLIILTKLDLANYRERVYPYLHGNPGPFKSDTEVNDHFYKFLKGEL